MAGLPAIFCYGVFDLHKRWLACMRMTRVPMIAMLVSSVAHVPFAMLFINYFDMGVVGLAVASDCREIILLTFLICYCRCSREISMTLQNFF